MQQYQVSFGDAIQRAFNKYCCFTGRASRSEYWWWILFTSLVGFGFGFLTFTVSEAFEYLSDIASLAFLLPGLGLVWRRLHDINRSGANLLWAFLPIIGWVILLIYLTKESDPYDNQYGPVPNMIY